MASTLLGCLPAARAEKSAYLADAPWISGPGCSGVVTSFQGKLFFGKGRLLDPGAETYLSDGSLEGTLPVAQGFPWLVKTAGRNLFFSTFVDGANNRPLWRTDGTARGTNRISDALLVLEGASIEDTLFFSSRRNDIDWELLKTDGTNIMPSGLPGATPFTRFLAGDGSKMHYSDSEKALWFSDGTPAGTTRVSQEETYGMVHQGKLYYRGPSATDGFALWVSDGTKQGTRLVTEIPLTKPKETGASAYLLADWRSPKYFYLLVFNPETKLGLWRSDGTAEGTLPLLQGMAGQPNFLGTFGDEVYFLTHDFVELWKTAGTAATTQRVNWLPTWAKGSRLLEARQGGDRLFFLSHMGDRGQVLLWSTDGTEAGSRLLADWLTLSDSNGGLPRLAPFAGGVAFISDGSHYGEELFVVRAGDDRPRLVRDLGPAHARPLPMVAHQSGGVVAAALEDDGVGQYLRLITPDGQVTRLWNLPNPNPAARSLETLADLTVVGDTVLFTDTKAIWGGKIGDRELTRIRPLSNQSNTLQFTVLGNSAFVSVEEPNGQVLLGIDLATLQAKEIVRGLGFTRPIPFRNAVYTMLALEGRRHQFLMTDGTAEGTKVLDEFANGTGARVLGATDKEVYLIGRQGIRDALLAYDGVKLRLVLERTNFASYFEPSVAIDGRLFFVASDSQFGNELWVTDGTPEGTHVTKDALKGREGSNPVRLMRLGKKVFFAALQQLWVSDGTDAGTIKVLPAPGGNPEWNRLQSSSQYSPFAVLNGWVYLAASGGNTGRELWRMNENPGSAELVEDLAPGSASSFPDVFVNTPGGFYYTALDPTRTFVSIRKFAPQDQPSLAIQRNSEGVALTPKLPAGGKHRLEESADLKQWRPIADLEAGQAVRRGLEGQARFYRVASEP